MLSKLDLSNVKQNILYIINSLIYIPGDVIINNFYINIWDNTSYNIRNIIIFDIKHYVKNISFSIFIIDNITSCIRRMKHV